jgi:hypothetical protein
MQAPIIAGYDQNILQGATITASVAPMSNYSLTTLGQSRPDFRVKWNVTTVTITFTIASSLGDILVIPMCNVSTGAMTLSNTTGGGAVSTVVPIPAATRSGIPRTICLDIKSLYPTASDRTSTAWRLVIASNAANVQFGGAVAIYSPKVQLQRGFGWGIKYRGTGGSFETDNPYLVISQQSTGTLRREIDFSSPASDSDADALEGMFDGCFGRSKPGFIWPDPDVEDGLFGIWQSTFERSRDFIDYQMIHGTFTELTKGPRLI